MISIMGIRYTNDFLVSHMWRFMVAPATSCARGFDCKKTPAEQWVFFKVIAWRSLSGAGAAKRHQQKDRY